MFILAFSFKSLQVDRNDRHNQLGDLQSVHHRLGYLVDLDLVDGQEQLGRHGKLLQGD
jgi:hypothetical protein